MELLLPTSDTKEKRISMNKENDGCWSCEVDYEAEGKPYLFGITHPGTGEKQSFEKDSRSLCPSMPRKKRSWISFDAS